MSYRQSGFSTIELIVVVAIISILSSVAIIGYSVTKKYKPDDQALKVVDVFQDARQKALIERTTIRVEIDKTKNEIHLIDENVPGNAADDIMVKKIPLDSKEILLDAHPKNVSSPMPTASSPIPEAAYAASLHPLSLNDQVMTFRFKLDGTVVNAGTNATGANEIVTGATVFVYDTPDAAGYAKIIRAVTLIGFTGASNIVKCQLNSQNTCANWVN